MAGGSDRETAAVALSSYAAPTVSKSVLHVPRGVDPTDPTQRQLMQNTTT